MTEYQANIAIFIAIVLPMRLLGWFGVLYLIYLATEDFFRGLMAKWQERKDKSTNG